MSTNYGNIEEFLRRKLAGFKATSGPADDWDVFERKLKRTILLRRLKQVSAIGVTVLLIGLITTIGIDLKDAPALPGRTAGKDIPEQHIVSGDEAGRIIPAPGEFPREPATANPAGTPETPLADEFIADHADAGKQTKPDHQPEKKHMASPAAPRDEHVEAVAENTTGKAADPAVHSPGYGEKTSENKEQGSIERAVKKTSLALGQQDEERIIQPTAEEAKPENRVLPSGIPAVAMESPVEESLQQLVLASQADPGLGFDGPELSVRHVVQKVKFSKSDLEPYISPLQEKNPWSYSLNVYPNFTFRKFKVDPEKANYIHRDFIDAVQVGESGGLSMNVGLRISRRVGAITYLNSGIEYINYKTEVQFDFMKYREANLSPITGEIKSYSLISEPQRILLKGQNTYHYLNIPLSISYQPWFNDHIRLNIETGASFMYFVTAKGQSINYQTLEIIDLTEREYRNYMASFCFKAGVNYYVSPQLNVGVEPTMVYFTNTIYSNEYPFEVIPYSVGVNLKLQVKLN